MPDNAADLADCAEKVQPNNEPALSSSAGQLQIGSDQARNQSQNMRKNHRNWPAIRCFIVQYSLIGKCQILITSLLQNV